MEEPKMEEIDEVPIYPDFLEHKIQIGARLNDALRDQIISFLSTNHDCFVWSHEDMTWINPEVDVHHLQVDSNYPSIKKKRRKFAPGRNQIINEEI